MAIYPMLKPALEKLNTGAAKVDGKPIMTVVRMRAVKSAEGDRAGKGRKESAQVNPAGAAAMSCGEAPATMGPYNCCAD